MIWTSKQMKSIQLWINHKIKQFHNKTINHNQIKINNKKENVYLPQIGNQQQFRICTNLRCLKCDLQVKCHINQKWNKDTDYLILRNYFNNMTILQKYLIEDSQYNAYNCQCTNVNAIESIATQQNWVCSGHVI
ncbi:unnamed protein product [Paramecium pentaurelia]|uniref:Cilia- and flagella-associated protein 418 n=1 Tax=Paramecium pentaurelia TaxID=43138 RepID=A0A8S1VRW7_9CILI|nr:unnamed protein product [Paramecium pentaurelia]